MGQLLIENNVKIKIVAEKQVLMRYTYFLPQFLL